MSANVSAIVYPETAAARTRWIVGQRSAPNSLKGNEPYAFVSEQERMASGEVADVATIFLTNRECPWKCVMCDLWRNTAPVPPGSIPRQIEHALSRMRDASVLKLYNAGSFFDVGAIPRSDWHDIITLSLPFEHLVVECHPRLVGRNVLEFAQMFQGQLEVAMGLETCNPVALEKLNKRITVQDFVRAAEFLRENKIAVRTFLLVSVPFIPDVEQKFWIQQSIDTAFDAGADVVSLIPTRSGNGALDALKLTDDFREPALRELEDAHDYGLRLGCGRVFADTWDLDRFCSCAACAEARNDRLDRMNLSQVVEPRVRCACEN